LPEHTFSGKFQFEIVLNIWKPLAVPKNRLFLPC
jgi:hypothetical protein